MCSSDLEKEKQLIKDQLAEEGKKGDFVEKIVEGKVNKIYGDVCLLNQKFVKNDKLTVDEVLKETNATDPMTVLWDKTSRDAETIARDRVKAKVDKFMVRSPFDDRFPDEMEFKLGPVTRDTAAGTSIYQVTDNPLADIPDTPPNQTQRVSGETGLSTHSDRIRQVAQDYHKIMGYSDPEFKPAMVFNDELTEFASPATIDECQERTIIVHSFSKSYAMTGWRIGAVTAPAPIIKKMALKNHYLPLYHLLEYLV